MTTADVCKRLSRTQDPAQRICKLAAADRLHPCRPQETMHPTARSRRQNRASVPEVRKVPESRRSFVEAADGAGRRHSGLHQVLVEHLLAERRVVLSQRPAR